jgi:hypothetical protein
MRRSGHPLSVRAAAIDQYPQPAHDPAEHYPQVPSDPNQVGRQCRTVAQGRTIAHRCSI